MKVEIVLSMVIAGCTVLYTFINLMMWCESRATRKQKYDPLIIAYLKSTEDHSILTLIIKNIGEGYAKDVNIKILKDYNQFDKKNFPISNIGIVKNGLNIFPPQYKLTFYINLMTELEKTEKNKSIELEILYKNKYNKKIKNKFILQFNQIFGQNYSLIPETYIGQISYYLKGINKTIKAKKNI